jgi:hemin uptake protein HemP
MVSGQPADSRPPPQPLGASPSVREVDSRELMRGDREIGIRHGAELYRLTLTRNGKLILRK